MSVSLRDSNARLFHNDTVTTDYSLRDKRFQMAVASVGPTSLLSVGEHAQGLQKHGTVPENTKPRCDTVSVEYMNNPPNLRPWAIGTDSSDFYGTQLEVEHGGYGDAYCGANANQYFNRKDASKEATINIKFIARGNGGSLSSEAAIVVVAYSTRDKRQPSTVLHSQKIGGGYSATVDLDVVLPANNYPWIAISVQNTAAQTGSGSTKYKMTYSRFECTYK